jgi:hypothetical protein
MDSYQRIAALKIGTAQDRAHAILQEVSRIENKVYPSPGSKCVLQFVANAARRIHSLLEEERQISSGDLLSPPEIETRLDRISKLIPFLHRILGFIDGSDVHRCPAQLVPTLRRYVRTIIPTAEIVVSSKPELNYSIQDIAGLLKRLFSGTSLEPTCASLPEPLFLLNIPAVESGQILIHGVLAHELGHALYTRRGVAEDLLPTIRLDDNLIKTLARSLFERQQTQQNPIPELRLREIVTQEVTERINGWIKELSSDAIGIRLFGPALFFAAVHLLTSFSHIDQSGKTHPPARLRVRLMIRMLKQLYVVDRWRSELQAFARDWDTLSAGSPVGRTAFDQLAVETVNESVLDLISAASASATSGVGCYSSDKFDRDVGGLCPLFLNHIPPGEIGPYDRSTPVELASIINAGWFVYLCDFDLFRKTLHPSDDETRFSAAAKLYELVLKAVEISGVRTDWEEAQHDSRRRENSGIAGTTR